MLNSDFIYDVYNTPRIGPVQFGEFVAADALERETILQGAKYVRKTHRVRAWFAKEQITNYLLSPRRSIGHLIAAVDEAKEIGENSTNSDHKRADALASSECLQSFIKMVNNLSLSGKEILAIEGDQFPIKMGGVSIQIDLSCLLRSVDKEGNDRVGAIFLNTQKGKGLGSKEDTKKKRDKAGEAVALLVFKRIQDEFSDIGEPLQDDAMHIYARGKHFWTAPKSFASKMKNLDAAGRSISNQWDTIQPPSDFTPSKAKFHD